MTKEGRSLPPHTSLYDDPKRFHPFEYRFMEVSALLYAIALLLIGLAALGWRF